MRRKQRGKPKPSAKKKQFDHLECNNPIQFRDYHCYEKCIPWRKDLADLNLRSEEMVLREESN